MPKPNDRIGPYELISKLGKGAFGEVWLAHDVDNLVASAPAVALKLPLDDDVDLDAIRQEATVWVAASGHPNVLPMLEARIYGGQVVIASEYAPDGSLQQWLKAYGGKAPTIEAALEMTRGILDGLAHLHSRRIVHRDLKPDNILLKGLTPRLADFGLSRVLKSTSMSAVIAGTPVYMAPEAFKGKRNQQTDLWSVGVMLYQLLSGRFPFLSNDKYELYVRIIDDEPAPLAAPAWLQQVAAKALSKNPADRFQTAEEMQAALVEPKSEPAPQPRPQPNSSPEEPTVVVEAPTMTRTAPSIPTPQPLPSQEVSTVFVQAPTMPVTVSMPKPQPRIESKPQPRPPASSLDSTPTVQTTGLPTSLKALLSLCLVGALSAAIYWASNSSMPITTSPATTTATTGQTVTVQPGEEFTETVNGVKLEMKGVPAGSFLMGSPADEAGHHNNEAPQHRVSVSAFAIGKYEITQAQWQAVMGNHPSNFKGANLPVEQVSWNDAKEFCQKLSQLTGKAYRLPTEAEWEYACRAGTTGAYASDLVAMAWYYRNSGNTTHPVGQKQPNGFGLFDMHGNVWEWSDDVWHSDYNGAPTDGSSWLSGGNLSFRVLRGGSWSYDEANARSAYRTNHDPRAVFFSSGVRVVVSAKTP